MFRVAHSERSAFRFCLQAVTSVRPEHRTLNTRCPLRLSFSVFDLRGDDDLHLPLFAPHACPVPKTIGGVRKERAVPFSDDRQSLGDQGMNDLRVQEIRAIQIGTLADILFRMARLRHFVCCYILQAGVQSR